MLFASSRAQTADGPSPAAGEQAERHLLARVANGDRRAFETLYRGYFPRLQRFLRRLLQRPHLVEEALNDAMLVVWRRATSFNGQSKVSTWIFAIAYRRALKSISRYDDPLEFDADLVEGGGPQPEEALARRELGETLERAMLAISPEQRAVVELTYFHGCRYQEIAEILACPVDTVKTRMFHARRRLRVALADRKEDLP
jgi:RNA polymerase sigma factor (sigma-70 family)